MKSALIAIDPTSEKKQSFKKFTEVLGLFQSKGFFADASVVSVIHPSLYSVPRSWYREEKQKYAKEAANSVEAACRGMFDFNTVKVLHAGGSIKEDLVNKVSSFAHRNHNDLLIVSSNDRTGLPYWILGSFSETAALTADLPVLVVKPHIKGSDFSQEVRLVVAVDVASPPSGKDFEWIAETARLAEAKVYLVYVEPKQRPKGKSGAASILKGIQKSLQSKKLSVSYEILNENTTVAHSISEFADEQKVWMIISVEPKRSKVRRLLLGSTTRRLLKLTKRPVLSFR